MTVCKVRALRFAKLVDPPLHEINRAAKRGGTIANIDLGEYGVLNDYGTLDHVRVPEPMMKNLGVGGVADHSDADVIEAVQDSTHTATVVEEPREVEAERENLEQEGDQRRLPAKRPQTPTLMHQFGSFTLYAGVAVGVGLALNALLGSGNRAI